MKFLAIPFVVLDILFRGVGKLFTEGETFENIFENAAHNREIDRQWEANGRPIIEKTVGWRPDPINKNDGFKRNGDGSYSRLVSGGTKAYRKRFARDVEESSK